MSDVRIVAAAQSPYTRHPPSERDGEPFRTETVLADAVVRALDQAGLRRDDVDGLGVASFRGPRGLGGSGPPVGWAASVSVGRAKAG